MKSNVSINAKSIRKPLIIIIAALILITITAYATYRITMNNISVSISEDTARLTIFNQSHDYDYDTINMNPTQGNNKALNANAVNHDNIKDTSVIKPTTNKPQYETVTMYGIYVEDVKTNHYLVYCTNGDQ